MTSPCKKKQPEAVADAVLKRAEVGKISRALRSRLSLAQFKAARGWEDLTLDAIEPRIEEEIRRSRSRPTSSGDMMSDSSSSASEFRYTGSRNLSTSPLKDSVVFSDQIHPRSGSTVRKRSYHNTFEDATFSTGSRKRYRSSPTTDGGPNHGSGTWKNHQLTQSSPIKPRKQAHFTTASGPSLSFFAGTSQHSIDHQSPNYAAISDDEENNLPAHSFNITSSPPRTPPPVRNRGSLGRRNNKNGRSGEEGADLLIYLATSPSPANPTRTRMQAPSTPPPKNMALPSSMMTTPGGGSNLLSVFGGGPNTPNQAFDFSDFVNITPSPAQSAWPKTPRTIKTPGRRRLDFGNFSSSPNPGESSSRAKLGLGMQLGGDLIS